MPGLGWERALELLSNRFSLGRGEARAEQGKRHMRAGFAAQALGSHPPRDVSGLGGTWKHSPHNPCICFPLTV